MAIADDDLPPRRIAASDDDSPVFQLDEGDDDPGDPEETAVRAPAAPEHPAPAARKRPYRPRRNVKNPQQRAAARVAEAQQKAAEPAAGDEAAGEARTVHTTSAGAAPAGPPLGTITTDDRDARVWWPRMLKEHFLDKGYSAADARIQVQRVRADHRVGEKPIRLEPPIIGSQVEGHENQSPGEALVEHITAVYHPEARGAASYKLHLTNIATGGGWVGHYGTLDLEAFTEIEARQRRTREIEYQRGGSYPRHGQTFFGRAPYVYGNAPALLPPATLPFPSGPSSAAHPPAASGGNGSIPSASTQTAATPPAPAVAANDANALVMGMAMRMFEELFSAAREGRQPVMPAMQAMPAAQPGPGAQSSTEEERTAKIVSATIASLVASGVLPRPTGTLGGSPAAGAVGGVGVAGPAVGAPTEPPRDLTDQLYEEVVQEEKRKKVRERLARSWGFVAAEDAASVEVPAPIVETQTPERREGQGWVDFMVERMMGEVAKNPAQALAMIGKIMDNPVVGGLLKDALAKAGMLPSIPTTGVSSPTGGGGFIP